MRRSIATICPRSEATLACAAGTHTSPVHTVAVITAASRCGEKPQRIQIASAGSVLDLSPTSPDRVGEARDMRSQVLAAQLLRGPVDGDVLAGQRAGCL